MRRAEDLLRQAQADVEEKYRSYEEFAALPLGPDAGRITKATAKNRNTE